MNKALLPEWYIYGQGGLSLETMDILISCINSGLVIPHACCFLVDNPNDCLVRGFPIVTFEDCSPNAKVTIAVGEPEIREKLADKCINKGLKLSKLVSPYAHVSKSAVLGDGTIIAPFVSVQAFVKIEKNVAVNTQAIIGHNAIVSEHAVISSQVNLGGSSYVGAKSFIGMGTKVKQLLKIGKLSIVGMGSVVQRDIPDEVIALGNPARVAKKNIEKSIQINS